MLYYYSTMASMYHPILLDNKTKFFDEINAINPDIYKEFQETKLEYVCVYDSRIYQKYILKINERSSGYLWKKKKEYYLSVSNLFFLLEDKIVKSSDIDKIRRLTINRKIELSELKFYYLMTKRQYSIGTYNGNAYFVVSKEIHIDGETYTAFVDETNSRGLMMKASDSKACYPVANHFAGFECIAAIFYNDIHTTVHLINFEDIKITIDDADDTLYDLWYVAEKPIGKCLYYKLGVKLLNECYLLIKASTSALFVSGQIVCSSRFGKATVKGQLFDTQKTYAKKILIEIGENLLVVDEADLTTII